MLLLLLGRQGPGYFNCNTAGSLEQSIPRLRDQADPLLAAVEALIAVEPAARPQAKVATLLAALRKAKGRDAVPLLISLRRRAVLAAQTPDSAEIVSRFLGDAVTRGPRGRGPGLWPRCWTPTISSRRELRERR